MKSAFALLLLMVAHAGALGDTGRGTIMNFDFSTRQVVVETKLQGESFAMAIDTGAPLTVLDSKLARQAQVISGGDVTIEGLGGVTKGELGYVAALSVGGLSVKPMFAVIADLSGFSRLFGRRIRGILGYDFLQQYQTTIDFPNGTIMFSAPEDRLEGGIPFTLNGCMPRVVATANGVRFEADLDTGSSGTTLPIVVSSKLRLGYGHIGRGVGIAGIPYLRYAARLRILGAGGAESEGVVVGYRAPLLYDQEELPTVGRIGNNFLRQYRFTLNYRVKQYRLEQGGRTGPDHEAVHPGVQVGLDGDRFVVEAVYPGSPAAEAGLAKGDRLLAIGGVSVTEWSLYQLLRRLEGAPGSGVEVRYSRGDDERTAVLKRVDWLR